MSTTSSNRGDEIGGAAGRLPRRVRGGAGVGLGIGRIGGSAMDAIGRQPEASGKIQTAMIIAAALIEGLGLFAVVVCVLIWTKL